MADATQAGYYVWQVPGKPVLVHLHLDVVDRLLSDVMRGFGAVPKRGAEVGGVLIGTIERGDPSIVRIEDFEAVECSYKRGPSYLFTDEDGTAFQKACRRWKPDGSRRAYAVGFFRSHTRDGMSLAPEDVELLDEYFSSPTHVALLIKPYGTKVSLAGFFIRENGTFPEVTPLEFPFRRRELAGDEAPPHRSMVERRPRERGAADTPSEEPTRTETTPEPMGGTLFGVPLDALLDSPEPADLVTLPSKSRLKSAIWVPLSFVFLLFGVALGMMIALTRGVGPRADGQDFSLGLTVTKAEDDLSVKWDRQAPAIRSAQHGVLEIEDGGYTKPVELDTVQLQSGSIIYRNSSNSVRFRLVVYPRAKVSVTETLDWKR